MTMVRSVLRTKRIFLPALLLSLVLGAALAIRLSLPAETTALAPAGQPAAVGVAPADHHGEPAGVAITAPGDGTWGGGSHHTASARPVAEQLAARADDVAFCVGSTLEPFDAAWAQLEALGGGDAAERTRRCLMELVFTHVDPATAENVRAQMPAFSACYQRAIDLPTPDKPQAMAEITECLTSLAGRSN